MKKKNEEEELTYVLFGAEAIQIYQISLMHRHTLTLIVHLFGHKRGLDESSGRMSTTSQNGVAFGIYSVS